MRTVAISLVLAAGLVGCAKSDENVADTTMPKGTGQAINPPGQALPPELQKENDIRRKAGEAQTGAMAKAAEQMKEAMARSGGK